jgi:hypothetical protein
MRDVDAYAQEKTAIESRRRIVSHSSLTHRLLALALAWLLGIVLGLATAGAIAAGLLLLRLDDCPLLLQLFPASAIALQGTLCSLWFRCNTGAYTTYTTLFPCLATHCLPNRGQLATHYQYIYIVYRYACCLQPQCRCIYGLWRQYLLLRTRVTWIPFQHSNYKVSAVRVK